jgi:two-component system phosphate regulon sensor histidine kinase PhoR
MGISILGIIAVQLVWMNNAIRVKNELFSRSVNEALNNTVSKLEDIHNFGVMNRMIFHDSVFWKTNHDENFDFVFSTPSDSLPKPHRPVRIIREFNPSRQNMRFEIKIDSAKNLRSGTFAYTYDDSKKEANANPVIFDKKLPGDSNVIILHTDTVITDVDSLYTVGVIKIDSLLTTLDTFNIISPDVSHRMKIKAGNMKRLATQVVTEIAAWDVNEIDKELLQNVLSEELQNKNIPIQFEFGILKDSILIESQSEKPDSLHLAITEFQVNLYPNDIIQKNLKLALFFPERDNFIYRSLNWLLMVSFLFSVIILLTFSLSIFYILRQKKISEMKSDFINNMTHEFKTPIATISVATDSIINDKVVNNPDRIRYFAGMIKKENTRMNRQVEDILTIARLDKKDFEFMWEPVDVHELINDAMQGIILQVEKRGGKMESQLTAANPVITTDKIHGTNIIYNLLDNAIKYSVDDPEIKITTANKSNGVLVSVEDKGIGMTKAVQSKIFERFYRQTTGNVHNVKGFGLGLSYVKAVLEANQGTISVHSEPGKGSRFDVFLPFIRE